MIYRDGPSGAPVCVGAISAREPRKERQIYCDSGHTAKYTVNEFFSLQMSPDGLKAALVLNRNNDRADVHLGILDLTNGHMTVATTYPAENKRNQVFPFAWLGEKLFFLEQNTKREALVALDVTTGELTELDHLPGQATEGSKNAIYEAKSGYFVYQEFTAQGSALRIYDPVRIGCSLVFPSRTSSSRQFLSWRQKKAKYYSTSLTRQSLEMIFFRLYPPMAQEPS